MEKKETLTFEEYSKSAFQTATYPDKGKNVYYPALGLGGESGEVLEKIKKLMRDKNGVVDVEFQASILKELGDVLWYINALSLEFGLSLNDVAQANLDKLYGRIERGTIKGSGDDR